MIECPTCGNEMVEDETVVEGVPIQICLQCGYRRYKEKK